MSGLKKRGTCSVKFGTKAAPRFFSTIQEKHAPPNSLGIMGGIFDPIHNGHLVTASLARDYFDFSDVFFIPSGTPPHKKHIGASPQQRLAMVKKALAGEKHMRVWSAEIRRHGYSFTIDTLEEMRRQYPDRPFYFIIGSDNLGEIETWWRWKEICDMVTFCVASRPPCSMAITPGLKNARIIEFPSAQWGLSSTMVRAYIANGYSCSHLVPESVAEYISKRKLYRR